jgi:integration host factor subunit alpha
MPTTVTRAELAEAVFRKVGISRHESSKLVDSIIEEICSALAREEEVKLSSFATFSIRSKAEREGRNPKTGETAYISPRKVISFKASSGLKTRVTNEHRKPKKSLSSVTR